MADEQLAPRVFFSYASEDEYWVNLFRRYFDSVGPVRILDYKAESIPYGPLGKALDERIETSAVVVAFVSNTYRQKEWTVAEWETGLSEAARRRLIFVPLMLDADAIVWWRKLRNDQKLTGLTRDYAYSDFTVGGKTALPGPDSPFIIQMINNLALSIRKDLEAPAPNKTSVRIVPSNRQPQIVVLGHPSASFPEDIQEDLRQLASELGTTLVTWGDGWRRKDAVRAAVAPEADPIFVQPITDAEAADYLEDKNKTNKYLTALGRPKSRVAIWLSARYADTEFHKAVKESTTTGDAAEDALAKYPALRTDSPDGLAEWLRAEIGGSSPADDRMVVQVEGTGSETNVKPEIAAATKLAVDQLKDAVWSIVSHVIEKPPPAPAWQFWDTQFGRQIKVLPGSRAIVAIHDLNIPPHPDPKVVRKKVEIKFGMIQDEVEAEQKLRLAAGKPSLKLFWTALLVNNAGALPFSNYPDDGRFKDWRLLEFSPLAEGSPDGSVPQPDPASLAVFRTNLLAWTASS